MNATATPSSAPTPTAPYSSPLAAALADDVLQRFLRYVRIDTQSKEGSDTYPSTMKQLDLCRVLVGELRQIGLVDAELDPHGVVMATLPSTLPAGRQAPVVGLLAHVDTSPEASGAGVQPQVIHAYDGTDITLPGDPSQVLRPSESPALRAHTGHDIITTDGTTLLGADDKAGVAAIMSAAAYLVQHPELPHGAVRIAFTPDEEVGAGTEHFDIQRFGAQVAYTVDASDAGQIEDETFSASSATVTIRGHNIHPGYAKGKMVNAVKLAAQMLSWLPADRLSPETTEGREGYVHPMAIEGGVEETTIRFIIRDFDAAQLERHEAFLQELAERLRQAEPRARVTVNGRRSYRNMKEYLSKEPRALALAEEAIRRAGLAPIRASIRGGTDGARLSERGLPTPNLFTGMQEYHSVREWVSIQDVAAAAATLVHLTQVWAEA